MRTSTDQLLRTSQAFAEEWAGALGFGAAPADVPDASVDVAGMSDAGLLSVIESGFARPGMSTRGWTDTSTPLCADRE